MERSKYTPAKLQLANRIHNMILAMINAAFLISHKHGSLLSHRAEGNENLMSSRIRGRLEDEVQKRPRVRELVNGPQRPC